MDKSIINFDNLYNSMNKCKNGVMWKASTSAFVLNGIEDIIKLESQLHDGTYKPRKQHRFMITSPKPRNITSVNFRDRVFQRTLNDLVVYPSATRSFIYDNAACQKGKGTDFARNRIKLFMHRMYRNFGDKFYVLQCDISGYYPNMKHSVVYDKFKSFLDDWAYKECYKILDNQYKNETGFDPGSQMVQIAGISVLDNMDHFIKEKLHIKCYIRYMDDFILLHSDPEYLEYCKKEISKEVGKIGFTLNNKKTNIYSIRNGILFLGFKFHITNTGKIIMLVDPQNVKRERRKLYRLVKLCKMGNISKNKVYSCYNSWKAHISKGNSHNLTIRMDKYFKDLWR